MADNYPTNPGTGGVTFASDELPGGVHVPRVKVQFGQDGQAQDVSTDAPLPVVDQTTRTTLAAVLAKLIAAPATAQGQADQLAALTTLLGQTDGLEGALASILAKLSADPATATAQAAELAKLTSIEAKSPPLSSGRVPSEADERVLAQLVDEASATVTYVCEAPAGTATSAAAWRCKRITVAGSVTQTQWAAAGAMTQIADNRASLTYA